MSAPDDRVDLEALKRPRLGGKDPTRLSHQPVFYTMFHLLEITKLIVED